MRFGRGRRGSEPDPTPPPGPAQRLDLTCTLDQPTLVAGLEDWAWLGLEGKRPLFASVFGHVFLDAADGVWWLDPNSGELTREWADQTELRAVLATDEGQDEYLLGGLAIGATRRGLPRRPDEIYLFTPPPILGGGFDLDQAEAVSFEVGMSLLGQIVQRVRDLPPGTPISGIQIQPPD